MTRSARGLSIKRAALRLPFHLCRLEEMAPQDLLLSELPLCFRLVVVGFQRPLLVVAVPCLGQSRIATRVVP